MDLTKKWFKRRSGEREDGGGSAGGAGDDDLEPMDAQEQEELVRSFEKKHAHQSRLWRRVFAGLLLVYAGFLVCSIFHHAWFPWELRYHAYFMDEVLPWMVTFADLVAVVACLLAAKGLLQNSSSSKQWMWYSGYASLIVAVFWLYYILRLPKFRWEILWLPFAPLSGAALCLYVDRLLMESLLDINNLRSHMYNFKAL